MSLELLENNLTPEQYQMLRLENDLQPVNSDQLKIALQNSILTICALYEDKLVGMGRLTGDGGLCYYIEDVLVTSEYRHKGIGDSILSQILKHIKDVTPTDAIVQVSLFASIGKEAFYKKYGFNSCPSTDCGCGMQLYLQGGNHAPKSNRKLFININPKIKLK